MSELSLYEQGFGSFAIGEMTLAMSMKSIREVVPLSRLSALPSTQPWIVGGLDFRGGNIPVLDLECLLKRTPLQQREQGCILLIAHDGYLLGLLIDQVKALFFSNPENIHVVDSDDPVSRIFAGSLMNPELKQLVNVLSTDALFAIPGLLKARDTEPHRQVVAEHQTVSELELNTQSTLMLMQSRHTLFAVNPKDIETTVANPVVQPTEFAGGFYKGNISYREQLIPAVDLAAYLGLGKTAHIQAVSQQAFVLRVGRNPVAFLIDRILDIVGIPHNAVLDLPAFGLKKASLLKGALPCTVFDAGMPHAQHGPQYFVLSCLDMAEDRELIQLASVMAQANASAKIEEQAGKAQPVAMTRLMVYMLHEEFATPIDQVREVLPYRSDIEIFERNNPLLGILTHRGEAIQVYDLAQWLGASRQQLDEKSSILLVEAHGCTVGYVVGSLTAIENAQWEPNVPVLGEKRQLVNGQLKTSQRLAQLGSDKNNRMLEVIDLHHQTLLSQSLQIPSTQSLGDPSLASAF